MEKNEQIENQEGGEEIEQEEEQWDPSLFESNWDERVEEFSDMNLKKDLLR